MLVPAAFFFFFFLAKCLRKARISVFIRPALMIERPLNSLPKKEQTRMYVYTDLSAVLPSSDIVRVMTSEFWVVRCKLGLNPI